MDEFRLFEYDNCICLSNLHITTKRYKDSLLLILGDGQFTKPYIMSLNKDDASTLLNDLKVFINDED